MLMHAEDMHNLMKIMAQQILLAPERELFTSCEPEAAAEGVLDALEALIAQLMTRLMTGFQHTTD